MFVSRFGFHYSSTDNCFSFHGDHISFAVELTYYYIGCFSGFVSYFFNSVDQSYQLR